MGCTPAPACHALLYEANQRWPRRNPASDGICSSPQHQQQNPTSDHDTGDAVDLTHDPANGCDAHAEARRIVARRDPRVKYVISNKQIARSYDKPGIPAWTWAPYSGSNPHTRHAHTSIYRAARTNTGPWFSPADAPTVVAITRSDPAMDETVYVHVAAENGSGWLHLPYAAADGWVPKGAVVHTKHPPDLPADYWDGITASVSNDAAANGGRGLFAAVLTNVPTAEKVKIGVWVTFGRAS